MPKTAPPDRVKIWNSYFGLARESCRRVFELNGSCRSLKTPFLPKGGTLGEEETAILSALTLCALAIEARANHLIEKLVESGRLTRKEGKAASFLTTERKWFLLPKLAGCRRSLSADVNPHKAILTICSRRNAVAHVQFDKIATKLPSSLEMLDLFEQFVFAMDDLNDVLGHSRGARKRVRAFGRFTCQ